MPFPLLTRPRTVLDREIHEPTLLAFVLAVVAVAVVLVLCIVAIAFVPAFGDSGLVFAAVSVLLCLLVVGLLRQSRIDPTPLTSRQRWFLRLHSAGHLLFSGVLACWLGLIAWSVLSPDGPQPPAKEDPGFIRVVTWNIHCGEDHGLPWKQFDWPLRKHALQKALDDAEPDILCVQEATPPQVAFLEKALPDHHRVGIGRDGPAGGEHCAIYFKRQRFHELGSDTFWLEEPIDQPRPGGALDVKRICTWVRLREQKSGKSFRVYNTHLYLTETPRLTAAKIIIRHLKADDDPVLLTADFNATPSTPSRRLFLETGLTDSAERAGKPVGKSTFQLYGIGLWCIDGILVDPHWRVHEHRLLTAKPGNTYPSDHFAVLADLELAR